MIATEDLAYVLLMWLVDRTDRDTRERVPLEEFASTAPQYAEMAEDAARLLEDYGHVTVVFPLSGLQARLTWEGLREADRVAAERCNHGIRLSHIIDQLVVGAFADPNGTVRLQVFAATAMHLGEHVDLGVVMRAARYLSDQGLAVFTTGTGDSSNDTLTLTSRGEDCALSGIKVRQYVSEQNGAAPVFHQTVYGGTAAQGMQVTQNVGVQVDQLAELVQQLRALAPQLPQDVRQEHEYDIEVLEDAERPTQERLGAVQRLKARLAEGAAQVGGEAVIAGLGGLVGLLGG